MESLFLSAVMLSLVYRATPGPVMMETLRRGLRGGCRSALGFQCGAIAGGQIWALVGLMGAAAVVQWHPLRLGLGLAGVLLIGHTVGGLFADTRSDHMPAAAPADGRRDFVAGLLIGLANPFTIAFWLGIGGGLLSTESAIPATTQAGIFLAGFLCGSLLSLAPVAGVTAGGQRFVTPTGMRWVSGICGVALAYFGVRLLAATLTLL